MLKFTEPLGEIDFHMSFELFFLPKKKREFLFVKISHIFPF